MKEASSADITSGDAAGQTVAVNIMAKVKKVKKCVEINTLKEWDESQINVRVCY